MCSYNRIAPFAVLTLSSRERKSAAGSFPTAQQVAKLDLVTLKSAGLSTRKAEYIQDLALRFSDGRLSTEKIMESTDEELAEMLIAVRGIGVVRSTFSVPP